MNKGMGMMRWAATIVLMMFGGGMSACADGANWKEEVLLHDGKKLIVERMQSYGGFAEPASTERSVAKEEWVFSIPGTGQKIVWKSDFSRPPEGDSLMLLQINFLDGIPYIATSPAGLLSYNYWKRPNPPYVFFKHDGKAWRQISLAEFPAMFKGSNVYVGKPITSERKGLITVNAIKKEHRNLEPYLRQILRQPVTKGDGPWNYPLMEYDGKGGWRSPGGAKAPNPIPPQPKSDLHK